MQLLLSARLGPGACGPRRSQPQPHPSRARVSPPRAAPDSGDAAPAGARHATSRSTLGAESAVQASAAAQADAVPYGAAQAPAEVWAASRDAFRAAFVAAALDPGACPVRAALLLAAEDDAAASKAAVPLPVDAYLDRLALLASNFAAWHGPQPTAEAACAAVDRHLYSPEYERFALARDDQHASPYRLFMQHALAQRVAAAPVLACVHGGLLRRLQAAGLVPPGLCVVLPEPGAGGGARLPRTSPGPDPASAVTRDLLLRTLRLLLRSYWSWEWREGDDDGGDGGGFLACARAAAGATGRVSTLIGGVILQPTGRPFGDLDGAARALERLVALHPSAVTRATRDLGALRAHTGRRAGGGGGGDAAEAQRLLAAYRASPAAGADGPDDRDALDALIVALERRALEAAFAGPAGG